MTEQELTQKSVGNSRSNASDAEPHAKAGRRAVESSGKTRTKRRFRKPRKPPMERMTFRIETRQREALEAFCDRYHIPAGQLLRDLVRGYLRTVHFEPEDENYASLPSLGGFR